VLFNTSRTSITSTQIPSVGTLSSTFQNLSYYKYYIQMTNFRMQMFSRKCFSALIVLGTETDVPESI